MNNKKYQYYFVEQVLTNPSQRVAYSFPDVIEDQETLDELIRTIESDSELKLAVLEDASRPEYVEAPSSYIWELLDKHPIGAALQKQFPGIEKYRISGALARGAHLQVQPGDKIEDTPFYKFDSWANKQSKESMPSFKKYIGDVAKYNPQQVSGASTKTSI